MADTPEAPAEVSKVSESVETPTNNNPDSSQPQTQMPDMHGFTSEELADIRKFFDNSGGFEKIKSKISNPTTTEEAAAPAEQPKAQEPVAEQPTFKTPEGAITQDELMAQYYFERLSKKPEYAPIAKEISGGAVLTEMAKLGIPFRNPDGSWNNDKINDYLDLRAKTVPAKATSTEPNMSNAPTVDYVEVGDKITDINQAYAVLQQDAKLKAMGQAGHPQISMAEDFIKNQLNPEKKK